MNKFNYLSESEENEYKKQYNYCVRIYGQHIKNDEIHFGKMKNEMFYGHEYEFTSLEQLQKSMEEYINYYNTERIQTKLKGLTPCQARSQALQL